MSAALEVVQSPATLAALSVASLASPHSRRAYGREIARFLESGHTLTREGVQMHVNALRDHGAGASVRNLALAAIRLLAREASLRGLLTDTELIAIERIKGAPQRGERLGNWLSLEDADLLLAAARETSHPERNRALIAVMIGCGLRRSEVCALTWEQWQRREGRWVFADITGKAGRVRTVPCPGWAADAVETWREISIKPFALTPVAIHWIVADLAQRAGIGEVRPHDLRRTCAKCMRDGGAPIEQIAAVLGHESVRTTERYLGTKLELRAGKAATDYIKMGEPK